MRNRRELLGALGASASVALLSNGAAAAAVTSPLARIDPRLLISEADATAWHRRKDAGGPTLAGSPSWHAYLRFLETKLREYGCVDIARSAWTFERSVTGIWPDKSKWGLSIDGHSLRVANCGANCGFTGPDGRRAELILWDAEKKPDVRGRIVVFRPVPRPAVRDAFSNSDYEATTPFDSWPIEGRAVSQAQDGSHSIASAVWDEMTATGAFVEEMQKAGAAGIVFAMNLNRAATEGLYTFRVPANYETPSVYVDRETGDAVIAAARAGKQATIRVEGRREMTETYQLVAYLPGRDYGRPHDQQVHLRTHTDGPSISQDNGGLGLLAVIHYLRRIPRADRPRSVMVELDCRHFMPGMERAWAAQDYFEKNPRARDPIVAAIAMEHLGQIDYVEQGDEIVPSGRSLPTWVYATDNAKVRAAALQAARDNLVRSTVIRTPGRPGIDRRAQGPWYGMGSGAQYLGIPGYGMQGDLGAYWAHSARIDRFDARSFRRQIGMFAQLTGLFMTADLASLSAPKVPRPA